MTIGRVAIPGLAAALIAFGGGVGATEPGADSSKPREQLREVEESLGRAQNLSDNLTRQAEKHAQELRALKKRMVAVAGDAQQRETRLTELEKAVGTLDRQQREKSLRLRKRQVRLGQLIGALQRLAQHPPIALIALPGDAADTVRSAILLRNALPLIEQQADALRGEIAGIAALSQEVSIQRKLLGKEGEALERERRKLAQLIARKARLQRRTRDRMLVAHARTGELARKADNLRDLLARLSQQRKAAPKPKTGESGTGTVSLPLTLRNSRNWPLPARGKIIHNYGQKIRAGAHARGVTIQTRPKAQVVSPRGGSVVFAGPFRGYGELLIIEFDAGYHVLMSGMARIDAAVGDEVLAGEPIGAMPPGKGEKPKLYLELRRKGVPVNPLPWLAATRKKVNG